MAVLDLNAIKEKIQTALESANTTTASTDLSSGLETRVQKVLKINPARIPVQATWYPFVTVYIDAKTIEEQTINRDQASGRRMAEVDIKIIGAVWNSTVSDEASDEASEDAESLMENVEQIMRSNTTLDGVVSWSFPTGVTYHNVSLEEETSIRAGIMSYKAKAFY